jgi:hypothetical protein
VNRLTEYENAFNITVNYAQVFSPLTPPIIISPFPNPCDVTFPISPCVLAAGCLGSAFGYVVRLGFLGITNGCVFLGHSINLFGFIIFIIIQITSGFHPEAVGVSRDGKASDGLRHGWWKLKPGSGR